MTSACSPLDWINTSNKEAPDHHLPVTVILTNTNKHRHAHTKSCGVILIHLSLTGSLAWDVKCVTAWWQIYCFRKYRRTSFEAVTLEPVSYSLTFVSVASHGSKAEMMLGRESKREHVMFYTGHKMTLWETQGLNVLLTHKRCHLDKKWKLFLSDNRKREKKRCLFYETEKLIGSQCVCFICQMESLLFFTFQIKTNPVCIPL